MGLAKEIRKSNRILRKWLKTVTLYRFRSKLKKLKKKFPEYFKRLDENLEEQHTAYWTDLSKRIEIDYLRLYCNFSGIHDYRYIPLNIYYAIVEPLLNDPNYATWYSDKNNLDQIISKSDCPKSYIKNIRGVFLNGNHEIITAKEAEDIFNSLTTDFIIKPTTYTFQGRDILLVKHQNDGHIDNKGRLTDLNRLHEIYKKNYIIQEKIMQHEEYARFNPSSVNSVRVNTYRSVKTEKIEVLNCFFKIGRSGQIIDNTGQGGLWIYVDENGKLDDFAFLKEGKCWKHPDSGISFKDMHLPFIHKIRNTAIRAAQNFPSHRILALDIAVDKDEIPKVLEVNLQRIGDPQYVGGTLFRSFTEEVRDYCITNKDKNDFRIIQF
jgi:hypothetical protein